MGCLQEEIPQDTLRFITAVNDMLTLSETVVLFPRWSRGLLPFWKRFVQAWDDLFNVGMQQKKQEKGKSMQFRLPVYLFVCLVGFCVFCTAAKTLIDRRIAEIEAQVCRGEQAEGMYLTYLLSSDKLTTAEVYISITELLLGGVDTVRRGRMVPVHTGGLKTASRLLRVCLINTFTFHQFSVYLTIIILI